MIDRTQPNGTLYEVQSWSPDSMQVAMSADIGVPSQYGWDTFLLNFATGHFTDISNQPLQWEEHAAFSPSGRKIAFATSYPFDSLIQQYGLDSYTSYLMQLRMEFFIMGSDGSNWGQLTYFNPPVPPNVLDPEYTPSGLSVANVPVWSTDGTMLLVGQEINTNPASGYFTDNQEWLITFTAPCQ